MLPVRFEPTISAGERPQTKGLDRAATGTDTVQCSRVQTERDGTRAETRFDLPAKRTSPFISAGVSVQSSTGFLGVRVGLERL